MVASYFKTTTTVVFSGDGALMSFSLRVFAPHRLLLLMPSVYYPVLHCQLACGLLVDFSSPTHVFRVHSIQFSVRSSEHRKEFKDRTKKLRTDMQHNKEKEASRKNIIND